MPLFGQNGTARTRRSALDKSNPCAGRDFWCEVKRYCGRAAAGAVVLDDVGEIFHHIFVVQILRDKL